MSQYRDDSQEIRRMLDDRIEGVCDALAPGWKKRGNTAYLTPKSAKELGSFTVSLRDGRLPRGCWHRFSQGIGGGSVELASYLLTGKKDEYKTAFTWARDFLGIAQEQLSDEESRRREERRAADVADLERRRAAQAADDAKRRQARVQTVQEIWTEAIALRGSHGDAYLQARGLPPCSEWPWDPGDTIRFHPAIAHERARHLGKFPTVVGKVVDAWGEHVALKLILLDHDQPQKCTIVAGAGEDPKPTMGPAAGGAIRIGGIGKKIGIGEGLETCLAAWALENYRYPVWAGLSTAGVVAFEPPMEVERVNIFPDGDLAKLNKDRGVIEEPPGMRAARALRDRLNPTGIKTSISEMCLQGDALDLWNERKRWE